MTESKPAAPARIAPAGLMFLAITSVGWGFNWPVTKYLLSELPPLTLRGTTGMIGALLLAVLALASSQSLKVERHLWPRLMLAALLNVTGWMVLMGLALLWLPASEAALIAYTMPVWASLLAWPVLGERPTVLRTVALVAPVDGPQDSVRLRVGAVERGALVDRHDSDVLPAAVLGEDLARWGLRRPDACAVAGEQYGELHELCAQHAVQHGMGAGTGEVEVPGSEGSDPGGIPADVSVAAFYDGGEVEVNRGYARCGGGLVERGAADNR